VGRASARTTPLCSKRRPLARRQELLIGRQLFSAADPEQYSIDDLACAERICGGRSDWDLIDIAQPEALPAVAIYHPDAPALFESFEGYETWYQNHISKVQRPKSKDQWRSFGAKLNDWPAPDASANRQQLAKALRRIDQSDRSRRVSVIPAISTLMDNRQACERFFVGAQAASLPSSKQPGRLRTQRVSQIVSLTGFSFVGGPAMNDSEAASEYLRDLNIPYRSLVSLDTQTIESWRESFTGLNPVQTGMQVAIPEIDGGTEPFVFGGISAAAVEPAPIGRPMPADCPTIETMEPSADR